MSKAEVSGKESVAIGFGRNAKAKGVKGCFLILDDWKEIKGCDSRINVLVFKIDGKKIKENTYYTLVNGKITETI